MTALDKPLSNLQIELLQLFSQGVSDEDLIAIKRLIAQYFADQASNEMDKLWEANNWSDKTMEKWLSGKASLNNLDNEKHCHTRLK